jgi:hypothetical protein
MLAATERDIPAESVTTICGCGTPPLESASVPLPVAAGAQCEAHSALDDVRASLSRNHNLDYILKH